MGKARAGEPGLGTPGRWQDRECSCTRSRAGNRHSGAGPKAGPTEGHWILRVNQEDGKAPNQAKPGAPASWGLPISSTSVLLTLLAQAASWEPLFSSFPFQGQPPTVCPAWEGAAASPYYPLLCFQQAQPQPDGKPKAFFPQWDAPEGLGRAARPRLLRVGQEQCPAPRALNA